MPDRIFPHWQGALFFLTLSADALFLPSRDWVLALSGAGLVLLLALLWLALLGRMKASDLFTLCARWPFSVRLLIALPLALLSIVLALRTARTLAAFVTDTALTAGSAPLIGALVLAAAWMLARRGAPSLFLWSVPVAWLVGLVFTLSLACSAGDWQLPAFDRLTLPLEDAPGVWGSLLLSALPALALCTRTPDAPYRSRTACGIALAGLALGLTGLRALAVLGVHTAALLPHPSYAAAGVFAIGEFLQRSEILFGAALSLCSLARAALCLCAAAAALRALRPPDAQTQKSPEA